MSLVKFSTQAEQDILDKINNLANAEGKHKQALINEALLDLIQKYDNKNHINLIKEESKKIRQKFSGTFKELAK
ncbi:MAG: hypothetical protein LBQ34_05350 [Alphaproteobacteria bacterium]|jgi:hypothetical protein|nr:hypothetical protein [Alphaproteobacteria bacterium]